MMLWLLAVVIGMALIASPASAQVDQFLKSFGIGQQSAACPT